MDTKTILNKPEFFTIPVPENPIVVSREYALRQRAYHIAMAQEWSKILGMEPIPTRAHQRKAAANNT